MLQSSNRDNVICILFPEEFISYLYFSKGDTQPLFVLSSLLGVDECGTVARGESAVGSLSFIPTYFVEE